MIFIDASFIIAFNSNKDIHHAKAKELWKCIENKDFGEYFISDHIFDEIISVSLRKSKDKDGTVMLGDKLIKTLPMVKINWDLFDDAWKIFKETKTNMGFTDCTNLAVMGLLNIAKIATFDKAFQKIEGLEVIN